MAKELPYYKHEPSEWLEGDIQICSDEAIVCFSNLKDAYWLKLGCMSYAFALQKYCRRSSDIVDELISNGIIWIDDSDNVRINFMDEQLNERRKVSDTRKKAAQKRWNQDKNANALQEDNKIDANAMLLREEEKREEKKRKEERINSFNVFWVSYDKKVGKEKTLKKWMTLKQTDIDEILNIVNQYVVSTPDVQFRKNPLTWLNGKHWQDDINPVINSIKPQNSIAEKIKMMRNGRV